MNRVIEDAPLSWADVTDAILAGHRLPKAEVADTVLRRGGDTLLTRSAWIDGLGVLVKAAAVFPNTDPSIHGGVQVFDDALGTLRAYVDFHLVTKWKTAGDSLLGAKLLARPDSKRLLIVGAGTVAGHIVDAYRSHWPEMEITVWNRNAERAVALAKLKKTNYTDDLQGGIEAADIICTCTMATTPVIKGDWLQAGQHLDLIGAYRADMREVDDTALTRARLFADSRETTIRHIGEYKDPIARGVISAHDIQGDLYDLADDVPERGPDDITIYKNGGGAHLDLMVADLICRACGV